LTGEESGSTAVCVLVDDANIYCGNIGDSRAVLCKNRTAIQLSLDHKPCLEEESTRIRANGGQVSGHYMVSKNGDVLGVSRAVGDVAFRSPLNNILISTPTMSRHARSSEDDFVVLACDGLFDVLSNQAVCNFVLKALEDGMSLDSISESLTQKAVDKGSKDNVTVIIVWFLDLKTGLPKFCISKQDVKKVDLEHKAEALGSEE
jgi:serine/threonine protein phosphatase PrpC